MQSSGGVSVPIAILLLDIENDRLFYRFRRDLDAIADEDALPVAQGMHDEMAQWAAEEGPTALFVRFLDTLSNFVTLSAPREVRSGANLRETLDALFAQEMPNVHSAR